MTVEEAGRFLDALAEERLGSMLLIQLLLGLRPGEVAALRWRDLDLTADPPTLCVTHSLRRTTAGMLLVAPKTPTSHRTLGLSPRLVEAILAQERQQATDAARQPAWSNPDGLMFTAESGTPLDPSNTRRALARIGRKIGLPGLHPHALRHATASLLSNAGIRLEDIADTLGHKSITVTANVYRHNINPTRTAHLALEIPKQ
ncbi:site-specific integrase [Actinotalea sp. K2]|uniref:site-specific integrase n=1 Tax=Actinotalea sp. K2 TaxID=2939438 RepID=UPI002016ABCE|nr:site-specific integrase [Actinotalea sp. K2]MCL3862107.1 site-specific integrase [Actinotalea sp. K2]